MILPNFAYSLSNRAFDLLYGIMYLARQNTKQIKEKGYFTVSMRAIQERLALPSEIGQREPGKLIRQPIDKAMEEIEENLINDMTDKGEPKIAFEIIGVADNANITEFLDNGKLKVILKDEYATGLIDIANTQKKKIETALKRKEAFIKAIPEKKQAPAAETP